MTPHAYAKVAVAVWVWLTPMCTLDAQNVKMTGSSDPLDAQLQRFSTMLTVRNLSASEQFYVRYLGFRVSERQDGLRLLERPGIALYLISESPPTPDKPSITLVPPLEHNRPSVNLVFRVSDARATHAALVKLGLRFLASPQQPPWGGWRCFAQGPDGYLIEIEQP